MIAILEIIKQFPESLSRQSKDLPVRFISPLCAKGAALMGCSFLQPARAVLFPMWRGDKLLQQSGKMELRSQFCSALCHKSSSLLYVQKRTPSKVCRNGVWVLGHDFYFCSSLEKLTSALCMENSFNLTFNSAACERNSTSSRQFQRAVWRRESQHCGKQ